jgi:glyoxylase-like metal-dependent hydrolase (beta-lactamase superfamily II)
MLVIIIFLLTFIQYKRGIMIDPPPFSTYTLKKMGIPSFLIDAVFLTHCHADHDAGIFQKILDHTRVEVSK